MKIFLNILFAFILFSFSLSVSGNSTFYLTENKGQVCDDNFRSLPDVIFTGNSKGINLFITNNGITYQFKRRLGENKGVYPGVGQEKVEKGSVFFQRDEIEFRLLNSNLSPQIFMEEPEQAVNNYYLPQCPNGVLGVKSFKKVIIANVYPYIDWVIYYNEKGFNHDFIVHPGGNPDDIQFVYKNSSGLTVLPDGRLRIDSRLGVLEESAPYSYQENGAAIGNSFVIRKNVVSFKLQAYAHDKDIIIDPGVVWSTYFGGTDSEYGNADSDLHGNVFLFGTTESVGLGTGVFQDSLSGGQDAYVSKFDANGNRLWTTYFGGRATEQDISGSTDPAGNIYLCMLTASDSLAYNGFQMDPGIFVINFVNLLVKFSDSGQRLWATYYGQPEAYAVFCKTDLSGNIYMTSYTQWNNGYTTPNSFQEFLSGGTDIYLVKFDSSGSRLWATFFGGSETEGVSGITTDRYNNVYLSGDAGSSGLAYHGFRDSIINSHDLLLVKFDSAGSRIWSTYYGGTFYDISVGCIVDSTCNVYLAGVASSTDQIAYNGFQNSFHGLGSVDRDGFLVKFDSTCQRMWGTYYGGFDWDGIYSCSVDLEQNVIVCGETYSDSIFGYHGLRDTLFSGPPDHDAFLASFSPDGRRNWSTYFGGELREFGASCFTDPSGNIYLAGGTMSQAGIAQNGYQNTYAGMGDAFLVKFNCPGSNSPVIQGETAPDIFSTYIYSTDTTGVLAYDWEIVGGEILSGQGTDSVQVHWDLIGTAEITVYTMYSPGCYENTSLSLLVNNIQSVQTKLFSAFPNPFTDQLHIEGENIGMIQLTDVCGRLVVGKKDSKELNTANIQPGIYFLSVFNLKGESLGVLKVCRD